MNQTFTVPAADAKDTADKPAFAKPRLDKFLNDQLPDISRSQLKKLILAGAVLVNGEPASVHRFLKTGDQVSITAPAARSASSATPGGTRGGTPPGTPTPDWRQIKVIAETADFIILDKPAGLLVHPTDRGETDTLADWLVAHYPELRLIGDDPARPAIVHRLDKDVSGLMLIPRQQTAFDFFKQQFKLRTIDKRYLALVHGEPEKDTDQINFPISRSKTKAGLYAAHPRVQGEKLSPKDKEAITEFTVQERFKNFALLTVKIFTGRTHQIRVHLLAYGHPVAGDKLYLNRKIKTKKAPERIFLHANYLAFTGPDGRRYEFESPLPEELNDFLKTLKKIS